MMSRVQQRRRPGACPAQLRRRHEQQGDRRRLEDQAGPASALADRLPVEPAADSIGTLQPREKQACRPAPHFPLI
jgi:hypothetical protein